MTLRKENFKVTYFLIKLSSITPRTIFVLFEIQNYDLSFNVIHFVF